MMSDVRRGYITRDSIYNDTQKTTLKISHTITDCHYKNNDKIKFKNSILYL